MIIMKTSTDITQNGGYSDSDENGKDLVQCIEVEGLALIYEVKRRGAFYLAHWKHDYNSDLCFAF